MKSKKHIIKKSNPLDSVIFGGSISSYLTNLNNDEINKVMVHNNFNGCLDFSGFIKYLSERFINDFYAESGTSSFNTRDFELFWIYMLNEAI